VTKKPKHMLVELPTADEIDALAITTPTFEVRKYEYDMRKSKADLKYAPCKGQVVVVMIGAKGLVLCKAMGEETWTLPSGRIGACEDPVAAAKRVAREATGLGIRSLELACMYDVTWHFSDVSIKRLHVVYAAQTDEDSNEGAIASGTAEARFFKDLTGVRIANDLVRDAILDCSEK